jgi:hypothetical protein
MGRHARRGVLIGSVGVLIALSGCGVSRESTQALRGASPRVLSSRQALVSRRSSFISLWPACACGKRTVLEQFSLKDGRRLRALATVPTGPGKDVADPHSDSHGGVWITSSTGPRCTSGISGCGPAPNSCSGSAVRFDPAAHSSATELTFPRSMLVTSTVPSPRGDRVVMSAGGCATSFFNQHLVVRVLRSGRHWTIGADAAPCHALGEPAWSPDGAELLFPYGPSVLAPHTHVRGGTCRAPRFNRLAVVLAGRSSRTTTWKLIKAEHGCSYQAATFDRWGIAAIEGCVQGEPRGEYSVNGGNAYLVQLNPRHHVVLRLELARGYNTGDIVNDPRTGTVLVSEYQAANQGIPVFNWVWAFDGHALRTVRRFPNVDAPSVIAEPW